MAHLDAWGVQCIRLHPSALLHDWIIDIDVDNLEKSSICIRSSERCMSFAQLQAVYYRKPENPTVQSDTGNATPACTTFWWTRDVERGMRSINSSLRAGSMIHTFRAASRTSSINSVPQEP